MKIYQLFESSYEDELLNEHLGTLSQIDPEFVKVLKKSIVHKRERSFGGKTHYSTSYKNKLQQRLGANSEIDIQPIKSAAAIYDTVKDDTNYRGFVISLDGKQVCISIRHGGVPGTADDWDTYCLFDRIFDTEDSEQYYEFAKPLQDENLYDRANKIISQKKLYKALTVLIKILKLHGKAIECMFIKTDTKKAELQAQRLASRGENLHSYFSDKEVPKIPAMPPQSGHKETQEEHNILVKKFKAELEKRLQRFKQNKSPKANTPEELIQLIGKEGFLDHITVNKIPYILSGSDNISLSKLKTKTGSSWDKARITYNADENSPQWSAHYEKLKLLKDMSESEDDYLEMREKYRMPRIIEVYLTLDKMNIVPYEISVKKFYDFT